MPFPTRLARPQPLVVLPAPHVPPDEGQGRFNTEMLDAIRKLITHPLITGNQLADVTVKATQTAVAHKLGKQPQGFFVVNSTGDVAVWHAAVPDDEYLYLKADVETLVDLWVY